MSEKKKRKQTASQLANLRPIQKGQVLNPEGGRAHDPLLRELRKFSNEYLRDIIETVMTKDLDALMAIANDKTQPVIKMTLARCVANAVNKSDWTFMERVFERVTGKVPEASETKTTLEGGIKIQFVDPK